MKHILLGTFVIIVASTGLALQPSTAFAGATERGMIEDVFKKMDVPEADRKQYARAIDGAIAGIRRYIASQTPAKGKPIKSTPNPLDSLITVAANLDTISCGTTLAAIRRAQQNIVVTTTREYRDPSPDEAEYLRHLQDMHDALFLACNPKEGDKTTSAPRNIAGVIEDISTSPKWPEGWNVKDISCFQDCYIPHYNYSVRADNSLPKMLRGYRESFKKISKLMTMMGEEITAAFAANPFETQSCSIISEYAGPINNALAKHQEARAHAKGNLSRMDKFYKDEVVACIKKCSKRVQIKLAQGYPETPEHQELRQLVLFQFPISQYSCEGVEWVGHSGQ